MNNPFTAHPRSVNESYGEHFGFALRFGLKMTIGGLAALVHPLTDDDLADHTRLAHWIGEPLELDLTTLDPPGVNQGVARFAKTDF